MSTNKVVWAHSVSGFNMSLAQLLGSGPKLSIVCGECKLIFRKRVPMVDYPHVYCPGCGTTNKLNLVIR